MKKLLGVSIALAGIGPAAIAAAAGTGRASVKVTSSHVVAPRARRYGEDLRDGQQGVPAARQGVSVYAKAFPNIATNDHRKYWEGYGAYAPPYARSGRFSFKATIPSTDNADAYAIPLGDGGSKRHGRVLFHASTALHVT